MDRHKTKLLFTCKGNNADLGQISIGDSLLVCIIYLSQVRIDKHETEG